MAVSFRIRKKLDPRKSMCFNCTELEGEAQHGPRLRKAGNSVEAFADGTRLELRVAFLEFVMPFVKVNVEDNETPASEAREEKPVERKVVTMIQNPK